MPLNPPNATHTYMSVCINTDLENYTRIWDMIKFIYRRYLLASLKDSHFFFQIYKIRCWDVFESEFILVCHIIWLRLPKILQNRGKKIYRTFYLILTDHPHYNLASGTCEQNYNLDSQQGSIQMRQWQKPWWIWNKNVPVPHAQSVFTTSVNKQ